MEPWKLKRNVKDLYDKIALEYDSSSKLHITRTIERCEEIVIRSFLKNKKFQKSLNLGAGTGRYIKSLVHVSKHTIALDFSLNMLKVLKRKHGQYPNLDLVCADIENLPFRNHVFDFAISTLTLDHIPNITLALHEIFKALNSNGELIISSLNEKILRRYREEHHIPKDMVDFETEKVSKTYVFEKGHTPNELTKLLEKIGFKEIRYVGCCLWPPITLIVPKTIRNMIIKYYRPLFDKFLKTFNVFKRNALLYVYMAKT